MSFPESVYTQFFTLNPIFIVSGSSVAFTEKKTGQSSSVSKLYKNVKLLVMRSLKLSRERVYTVFYAESEFHSLRV